MDVSSEDSIKDAETSKHVEYIDMEVQKPREPQIVGTVQLLEDGDIILVPTPTQDPRDPLNLPSWHKIIIVCNVSVFAAIATLMASSFGTILPSIDEEYNNDPRVNDLITYPALFIGIGNFIFVPIAHAIGRRPVYLFSLLMLTACSIWCALSKSLTSHIIGRDLLSLAAGQAEALCPIMVQEVYFLHQRGRKIAWFSAAQSLGTAVLTVASSYLASNIGWRWWYGVFACIDGACLLFAIFFVVETKYERSPAAKAGGGTDYLENGETRVVNRVKSHHRAPVDRENYPDRSFWYDIALFHGKPHWQDALDTWKKMLQVILFPNILWLVLCSGAFLGIFVLFGAVYASILVSPPYNFKYDYVGLVFAGQIVVAFVAVPLQGYLSDYLVKVLSKRNNGVTEPEYRLITLVFPFVVGIISTVLFGQAAQHPTDWDWSAIVVTFNAEYFGFIGMVIASFTYAIDSYPAHTDAALVVLCFARGVISFGVSYAALDIVQTEGYAGTFNICAIILGVLGFVGIFVYIFGKKIRAFTQPWAAEKRVHS